MLNFFLAIDFSEFLPFSPPFLRFLKSNTVCTVCGKNARGKNVIGKNVRSKIARGKNVRAKVVKIYIVSDFNRSLKFL